jgi:hypothetical protein
MKLGEILVDHGWISQSKLNEGLQLQFSQSCPLGRILILKKWITEEHLEQALLEQYWRNHGYWVID